MKKFYYLLASIVLFIGVVIACVNPSIEADELQALEKNELQAKPTHAEKVEICHWDEELGEHVLINVATVAAESHLKKHDNDKPINSPEGEYTIYRENGQVLNITIDSEGIISSNLGDGKLVLDASLNYVMLIWQPGYSRGSEPYDLAVDMWGRHEIAGFELTDCDGFALTTNLKDYYGGGKDDYSWSTNFE